MATEPFTGLTAVPRGSMRENCRQALRGLIISGALRPGDLHSIGSVAEQLEVSITPVREALLDLARDEMVEMVRNRGFRVVTLTDDDLDELTEVRLMLEVPAMASIAALDPVPDLGPLRAIAEKTTRCAAAGDMVGFLSRDRELHLGILELTGNRRLVKAVGLLRDQTRLYGLQTIAGSPAFLHSAAEHDQLLDLLESADVDGASALMRHHLLHVRGLWAGRNEDATP